MKSKNRGLCPFLVSGQTRDVAALALTPKQRSVPPSGKSWATRSMRARRQKKALFDILLWSGVTRGAIQSNRLVGHALVRPAK